MSEITRNSEGFYCGSWHGKNVKFTSVTTAIKPLSDFSMVPKDIMRRAQEFGTAVHSIVELHEKGTLDEKSLCPPPPEVDMTPILEAWKKCKFDQAIKVMAVEDVVVSLKYKYAGRLDVIAMVKGIPSLIEIKSRKYNPVTEKLQTIAYLTAWNECHPAYRVRRRYFCELCVGADNKPNGLYDWREIVRQPGEPDHLSIFRCSLALSQWRGAVNG